MYSAPCFGAGVHILSEKYTLAPGSVLALSRLDEDVSTVWPVKRAQRLISWIVWMQNRNVCKSLFRNREHYLGAGTMWRRARRPVTPALRAAFERHGFGQRIGKPSDQYKTELAFVRGSWFEANMSPEACLVHLSTYPDRAWPFVVAT